MSPQILISLKMSPLPKEVSKFPDQYTTSKNFLRIQLHHKLIYLFTKPTPGKLCTCLYHTCCVVEILHFKWKMFKDKIWKVGSYKIYFISKNFVSLNKIMKTMSLFIAFNSLSWASLFLTFLVKSVFDRVILRSSWEDVYFVRGFSDLIGGKKGVPQTLLAALSAQWTHFPIPPTNYTEDVVGIGLVGFHIPHVHQLLLQTNQKVWYFYILNK